MELNEFKRASRIAHGLEKADLVIKNARVVNVFTEEIVEGDIAVADGKIVGVGVYEGLRNHNVGGAVVCPGFIDSHLHLESTLVTPGELICQAAKKGTTTFIVDPHESANVSGSRGIDYILEQTKDVPANVYVMMPSCVPSTEVDDNGCVMRAADMKPYLNHPRILGLGEVMDYISVTEGKEEMHEKLELFRKKQIDGHAPYLSFEDLTAYTYAGITTDHECVDYAYAMEERRMGMTVLIREGSAAKNLEDIVGGIVEHQTDTSGFCFCTDDKHIEDIQKEGHINYNVKRASELGIPVIKAIKMATLQPARTYGLTHLGAIAPGYQADFVVMDNLENQKIFEVYFRGERIENIEVPVKKCDPKLKNTVHLEKFEESQLKLYLSGGQTHVIEMQQGQITTRDVTAEFPEGEFKSDGRFQKIAAVERHKNTGLTGVGIVKGFGIRDGAIASSMTHDSHNIIVIGDNDRDMALAVKALERVQGGYTIVERGRVAGTLRLPIMGLMSDDGYEKVRDTLEEMIQKAHEMGVDKRVEPFVTLSFMALPVIPEIRITPRGVYQVAKGRFLDL